MPRFSVYLLGPPRLELDGSSITADRRKALGLLAYLAVNRGQHSRDYLSGLLWPDYPQSKAFTNLRHTLWEIQQAIGDGWLQTDRDTIGLISDASKLPDRFIWLDADQFESFLTEANVQEHLSLRIRLLTDAVKLYRNHFLTGFSLKDAPAFNDWTFAESETRRHQLAEALSLLSNNYCARNEAEAAIPYARRLITLDPLNEAAHRRLMQIYIQAGQTNAALKQYQACEQILRKELGLDPQPETRALFKQIRKRDFKPNQSAKPKEMSGAPRHNLPSQVSTFIGREKEQSQIADLITNHRLVTLIGPGGIGKTRLSLKLGEHLLTEYAGGVWFAELAPLSDPTFVLQTVAKLFNLVEQAEGQLTEKLIHVLNPQKVLLILDNCEHLLEACAQLTDVLLRHCPDLKVLATSREPLGITGEARYPVPSLALPDVQRLLEELLEYESLQLFQERARLVQENFSLTLGNAASIAHICHRLDGIPLAIELAAARINLLSTEQIAVRLDESFKLLTGGSRTTLPRHRTLRASIDWSWNLLSDPERLLLRRLSVFAGGWTLDAAEAVNSEDDSDSQPVLEVLAQLVAKSLVVARYEDGHERRYRLLEMVREYAHEKLVEADEEQLVRARHLAYFLDLSERIEREVVGPQQMEWYARTNAERDNLRAALEYASLTNQVEAGLFISSRLKNYWEYFDGREGAHWLAEFLQKPASKEYPLARAKALYTQGWFMALSNQVEAAHLAADECLTLCRAYGDQYVEVDGLYLSGFISVGAKKTELCQQALALARSLGDKVRQAAALNFLGWDHSDLKRAFAAWEEAISLNRQIGNRRSLANCLGRLGYYYVLDGQIETAEKYLNESDLLYRQLNISAGHDHLITAYGQLAYMRGDYEKARSYFQENARIANEVGSEMDSYWSKFRLGAVELRAGNLTEARQLFTECARAFQRDKYTIGVAITLQYMASLLVVVGKAHDAARLIGWADMTRAAIKNARPALEQADVDRDVAAIVAKIGKKAFAENYEQGRTLTLDETMAFALDRE